MRKVLVPAVTLCGLLVFSQSALAQSGGQITGFGGSTFGTTTTAPTFGGGVAIPLGDNAQIVGEFGRLTDIKSDVLGGLLDFDALDLDMSAWYAEGGLRFTGSRHSAVRPYVEATAGVARLKPSLGLDGFLGSIADTGLSFLSRTEPMVGAGGGVLVQGGPVVVDLGYRYKRILASDALSSAFSLDNNGFDVNQVRVGVGIRF
jgi:opacity protein-like surface antigen